MGHLSNNSNIRTSTRHNLQSILNMATLSVPTQQHSRKPGFFSRFSKGRITLEPDARQGGETLDLAALSKILEELKKTYLEPQDGHQRLEIPVPVPQTRRLPTGLEAYTAPPNVVAPPLDADFLALGLGGTGMMGMLWTVAMGYRAVGVEMRGGPFRA